MLVVGSLTACAGDPVLADPAAAVTRAEQARLVKLLATDLPGDVWAPAACSVRVLRSEGATTWAWADCTVAAADDGGVRGGWSAPIRVDGDEVTVPKNGTMYEPSINEVFPEDLARYVLDHPDGL